MDKLKQETVKAGRIPRPRLLWSYGRVNEGCISLGYMADDEGDIQGLNKLTRGVARLVCCERGKQTLKTRKGEYIKTPCT